MRSLLLTDIHGNIEALDAVLAVVPREAYDRLLVLGDLVGYGASPNEVVDRVRALHPDVLIRGNHDKVASGVESPEHFNFLAAEARGQDGQIDPARQRGRFEERIRFVRGHDGQTS